VTLPLDGNHLTIGETCSTARARTADVRLAPAAYQQMNASRALVDRLAAGDAPIYAVNTGVGLLADVRIPPADLERLQRNVIRSHCAGVGEPLGREVVRAMMLIRANVLAKGLSGIRPLVAERICELINLGVTPVVPSQGSVGASGDLAPLAHMAMVLIGEGEAEFEGRAMPGAEALRRNRTTHAGCQGRHQPDQRDAGDAGHRLPGTGSRANADRIGRRDLRHDAGRAARHPARLRPADS
jgi:histidine ammonia-lyase